MEYKCSKCSRESKEKETCCDTEMEEKVEGGIEGGAEENVEMPKEEESA